jgi:outer membrane protein
MCFNDTAIVQKENSMKPSKFASLTAGTLVVVASSAYADAGDIYWHLRALNINPNVSTSIAGLDIDTRTTVEVGGTYFFTKEIAAELGVTQAKHDVTSNNVNVGTFKITPVNLAMQYHWNMGAPFTPYAGAGINYTKISGVDLGSGKLDNSSNGGLLQLGGNYDLSKQLRLNGDIKKVWIKSDVFDPAGAKVGNVDVNPWFFSVGAAMKF